MGRLHAKTITNAHTRRARFASGKVTLEPGDTGLGFVTL
jgi:hypothetical protein